MLEFSAFRVQGPRGYQEDSFLAANHGSNEFTFVVADGMGGHANGEAASQAVCKQIRKALENDSINIPKALRQAKFECEVAGDHRGTTATVAHVDHDTIHVYHVGDSRFQLFADSRLHRLTTDHGWGCHLTNCVGGGVYHMEIDIDTLELKPDGIYFLTTDGIHDYISELSFLDVIKANTDFNTLAEELCQKALDAGTRDNCTAIVFRKKQ